MFVVQTDVMSDKPAKDLDQTKDEANHIDILRRTCSKVHENVNNPNVSKENILYNRYVIVPFRPTVTERTTNRRLGSGEPPADIAGIEARWRRLTVEETG